MQHDQFNDNLHRRKASSVWFHFESYFLHMHIIEGKKCPAKTNIQKYNFDVSVEIHFVSDFV